MPVPKQVGEVKALKKEDSVGGASLGISSSIFHWLLLKVQILNAARKVGLQGLSTTALSIRKKDEKG